MKFRLGSLCLALILLTGGLYANSPELGLKAEMSLSYLSTDHDSTTLGIGLGLGGMAQIPLGSMFNFSPGFLLNFRNTYESIEAGGDVGFQFISFEIPLKLELALTGKANPDFSFIFGLGPSVFLNLQGEVEGGGVVIPMDSLKTLTFGFNIGLGFRIKQVLIDLRYMIGLSHIGEGSSTAGKLTLSGLSIGLGVYL